MDAGNGGKGGWCINGRRVEVTGRAPLRDIRFSGWWGGHGVDVLDDTLVQWRDFIPITSCSVLLCRMHRMMGDFFLNYYYYFKGFPRAKRVCVQNEEGGVVACPMAHHLLNFTVRGLGRSSPLIPDLLSPNRDQKKPKRL